MKIFSTLLLSSFITCAVTAGSPPKSPPQNMDCMDCPCEIPTCRDVMFEIYGDFLVLQPNGSNLYYAVEAIPFKPGIPTPAVSPNWIVYEITPNYTPGFQVGVKLLFSDMSTNLEANYERLYSTKNASYDVALSTDMIGPIFDIGPNSAAYLDASTHASFEFDGGNLLFGQQTCAFKRLYPNLYAGGTFARIKQSISSTYENHGSSISRNVDAYSSFIGAGPEIGLDFAYRIVDGFFFTGTSNVGLLVGRSSNGTTYASVDPILASSGNPDPNTQGTTVPNRTQVVPSLEEKMGFSYAGNFSCWRCELGVGYQVQIFLNAVQSIDMVSQVLPNLAFGLAEDSGLFAVAFQRTLSNFILQGPYVSLSFDF